MSEQPNGLDYLFDYDLDKEAKLVYFYADVTEASVSRTIKSLYHLDHCLREAKEPDPKVCLYINSNGGSVEDSFALYDCIQSLDAKVMTIGTGLVASAAVLLLACGAERYATENCWMMAHQAEMQAGGNEHTVAAVADVFKQFEKQRYELLARHTKLTATQWKDWEKSKGEVWMNSKQMLKAGVIDKVLPPKPPTRKRTKK